MLSRSTLLAVLGWLAVVLLTISFAPRVSAGGYKRGHGKTHEEKQAAINTSAIYTGATARPVQARPVSSLPARFDWCDVDGQSFCTASWNQHIPKYCGSCWIHGALAAANDRIKVLMDGKHDVMLARQVLLNCGQDKGLGAGCDGGESFDVFEYMHRYGLPDESCANYMAEATPKCDQQAICSNCMPIGEEITPYRCWAVPSPILYYVHEYGQVHGEAAMMSEIFERGPITCGFASVDDFDYNYRSGIYIDATNATEMNHDVEVVGWGEENGVKYWRARNSWGTYWGENGFFRIQRGTNNMQFESDCVFALFDTHHLMDVLKGKMGGSMFGIVQQADKLLNLTKSTHQHVAHTSNPNKDAEKEGRRAEKLDKEAEEAEVKEEEQRQSGFSHSYGHNHGHRPRKERGEDKHGEVKSGHFGGEPTRRTSERLHALDAAERLETFSTTFQQQQTQQHADSDGQQETDNNTMDRESGQGQDADSRAGEQPAAVSHGSRSSSRTFGASRGASSQLSSRRDSSYAEDESDTNADLSPAERDAEASIMVAIRAAYQREQTRKRTPAGSDSDNDRQIDAAEKEGRRKDEVDIAAAIHKALKSVGDREAVKAALLRCLQRLEDEEAEQVKAAGASGADVAAVRSELDRDVRIVEEETGRMWRQQSANATTEDVSDSIAKFIDGVKERGRRLVDSISKQEEREQSDDAELQQEADVDVDEAAAASAADMSGHHLAFGVLVGVVLGVVLCVVVMYVVMKHKERNDYMEL